nr:PREDICTED: uncharacterized protein LOC661835 isoform X2 [Tribolium castaneum]|eukprot:XP_976399.1 PREDICTED: uncharacterized protein LOC661835 isoform X2 [Tribolium castaneum]
MRDNFNMLPIVQDNMNYIPRSLTNLSSNGYYGYQPPLLEKMKEEKPCFMEVQQFENPSSKNRKRAWDFGTTTDLLEFKKRRQNEKIISRKKSDSEDLFEELLRETHGSNLYNYWKSDDL